jgi:hypothetical protein
MDIILHASDIHRAVKGLELMYVTPTNVRGLYHLVSSEGKVDIYTVQDDGDYLTFVCNKPYYQFYQKPLSIQLQRIGHFQQDKSPMELYTYTVKR